jgi:anaerobic selenocysteine-containing dehydrogenase
LADAVLPATTPPETEGSYINLEGRIQRSKKIVEPAGEARPDWWILSQLAQRLGHKGFAYKGPAEIAEELARTVPALREVSRPTKKGRPAFVAESPRPAKGFIPLVIEPPDLRSLAESQLAFGERLAERYRGFDLVEQVRGLKRLRERSKVHHG